jgi:thiamine biosynthesis lipoprotein
MDVARASGGAYDPCAGALVNLWGFGRTGVSTSRILCRHPPMKSVARAQLAARPVQLQREGRRALQPGGVQLDCRPWPRATASTACPTI